MGYRSDVGIALEEKAYAMLAPVLFETDELPDKVLYNKETKTALLLFDWRNWNKYWVESVKKIEAVLDKLDEIDFTGETDGFGYKMIRLGEEDNDIESRDNCHNVELYYRREIDTDGYKEEKNVTHFHYPKDCEFDNFCTKMKYAMQMEYEEEFQIVSENGLCILAPAIDLRKENCPSLNLDEFFQKFKNGTPVDDLIKKGIELLDKQVK